MMTILKTKLSGLWSLSLGDVAYIGPVWRFVRRVWDWCVVTVKRGVAGFFSILTNPLEVTALVMAALLFFVLGSQMGMSYTKWRMNVGVPTTQGDASAGWKEQALAAQKTVYRQQDELERLQKALQAQKSVNTSNVPAPATCAPEVKYVRSKCPKPNLWKSLDPVNW